MAAADFDPQALEGLKAYELSVGLVVEDDDPDPNTVKKLAVATRDGEWDAERGEDGHWQIAGQTLGPDMQRVLDASAAQVPELGDLSEMQGEESFLREAREHGGRGFHYENTDLER